MDKFRVAVSSDFLKPDGTAAFASIDPTALRAYRQVEYEFLPPGKESAAGSHELRPVDLAEFDAAICWTERFTEHSVPAGSRFTLLQRFGAGYERIDLPACTRAGIALATVRDGVRRPVAVMLLMLILAVTGKLLIKDRLVRAGAKGWAARSRHMGVGVIGKTLGLLGLGNTGAETVRLTSPLDVSFIAYDPYAAPETASTLGVRLVALDDLFRESDILVVACPLTEQTYHLVNAERLALMRPGAFLINGARGPIVDQSALVDALSTGGLAGAGLDVLEREPPDPDEPIFELDNVVLGPHTLCWTDQCFADCFTEAMSGVLDLMHGREPPGIINREVLQHSTWREKLRGYQKRFGG